MIIEKCYYNKPYDYKGLSDFEVGILHRILTDTYGIAHGVIFYPHNYNNGQGFTDKITYASFPLEDISFVKKG